MRRLRQVLIWGALYTIATGCSELSQPVQQNPEAELEVHPEGWVEKTAATFHGLFIRADGWNLRNCQRCHGVDYAGGIAGASCLTCHPKTPEDCIVCHGGTDNASGAPPVDLDDNEEEDAPRVGAHSDHVEGRELSDGIPCASCHLVPQQYEAPGHVDSDLPAEVRFDSLAILNGAEPVWDRATLTCAESYCHGNWSLPRDQSGFAGLYVDEQMVGNRAVPIWTDAETVTCGSCHDLPPVGHVPQDLGDCATCHGDTVDEEGNIVGRDKHINGMVNVFGQEYPMFSTARQK